ncbi:uncharacterized protein MONBRDRAFT_27408, partial [Monosiga brevicollis MX1]
MASTAADAQPRSCASSLGARRFDPATTLMHPALLAHAGAQVDWHHVLAQLQPSSLPSAHAAPVPEKEAPAQDQSRPAATGAENEKMDESLDLADSIAAASSGVETHNLASASQPSAPTHDSLAAQLKALFQPREPAALDGDIESELTDLLSRFSPSLALAVRNALYCAHCDLAAVTQLPPYTILQTDDEQSQGERPPKMPKLLPSAMIEIPADLPLPYEIGAGQTLDGRRAIIVASDEERRARYRDELLMIVKHLVNFSPFSQPFLEPVDPSVAPQYAEVISSPMDLGTLRSRVLSGHYDADRDGKAFMTDLRLIFTNCRQYNQSSGAEYVAAADKLEGLANLLETLIPRIWVIDQLQAQRPLAILHSVGRGRIAVPSPAPQRAISAPSSRMPHELSLSLHNPVIQQLYLEHTLVSAESRALRDPKSMGDDAITAPLHPALQQQLNRFNRRAEALGPLVEGAHYDPPPTMTEPSPCLDHRGVRQQVTRVASILTAHAGWNGVEQVTLNTLAAGAERYLEQLCRRTAQIRDHTFSSESLKVGKFLVSINMSTVFVTSKGRVCATACQHQDLGGLAGIQRYHAWLRHRGLVVRCALSRVHDRYSKGQNTPDDGTPADNDIALLTGDFGVSDLGLNILGLMQDDAIQDVTVPDRLVEALRGDFDFSRPYKPDPSVPASTPNKPATDATAATAAVAPGPASSSTAVSTAHDVRAEKSIKTQAASMDMDLDFDLDLDLDFAHAVSQSGAHGQARAHESEVPPPTIGTQPASPTKAASVHSSGLTAHEAPSVQGQPNIDTASASGPAVRSRRESTDATNSAPGQTSSKTGESESDTSQALEAQPTSTAPLKANGEVKPEEPTSKLSSLSEVDGEKLSGDGHDQPVESKLEEI